ncbi:MAG: hypothetical protein JXA74_15080, partial [Anaerolineae bacterium]|nr:hypothetical protein [Anaerolineae bacterium]
FALMKGHEGIRNADLQASLAEHNMGLRQPIAQILDEDKQAIAYHEAGHAVVTWALTDDRITRAAIVRYSGGPGGGASLGHIYHVPNQERVGQKSSDVAKRICVSLAGRASELEFLGQPHMGAGSDMMSVRGMLLSMAQEGLFSSIAYAPEPTPELVKELDRYANELMALARRTLRQHAGKVHALVEALMEREELDADEVMAILGPRPHERQAETEDEVA